MNKAYLIVLRRLTATRFYCGRDPMPYWYARVAASKKFCRRVVCLTATLRVAIPPAASLLHVKVGDAVPEARRTRLHTRIAFFALRTA
ncbi:unnamed protein product, partial [Iphiclides podalirius]